MNICTYTIYPGYILVLLSYIWLNWIFQELQDLLTWRYPSPSLPSPQKLAKSYRVVQGGRLELHKIPPLPAKVSVKIWGPGHFKWIFFGACQKNHTVEIQSCQKMWEELVGLTLSNWWKKDGVSAGFFFSRATIEVNFYRNSIHSSLSIDIFLFSHRIPQNHDIFFSTAESSRHSTLKTKTDSTKRPPPPQKKTGGGFGCLARCCKTTASTSMSGRDRPSPRFWTKALHQRFSDAGMSLCEAW